MKKLLTARQHAIPTDLALLVLRVLCGTAMALHGWGKIQNPFDWMGPDAFAPSYMQGLAALSEFGGGIAWALGFLTPLATLGIASTMGVAIYVHAYMNGDPFVAQGPGPAWELAGMYFSVALLLLAAGPGRFSLDHTLFGPRG